ncbi:MAG: hypothetical protein ACREPK_11990 [Rhodanobacteraceae bacterium]
MNKSIRTTLLACACFALAAPVMARAGAGSGNSPNIGHSRVTSDQAIAFDQHGLVMTAKGRPVAHVTVEGDLHIGNRKIATTAAQRDLLRHYYAQAKSADQSLAAVSKSYGVSVAKDVPGIILAALFGSDPANLGNQHELGKLAVTASRLCGDLQQVLATQKQVQVTLASLKSYAAFRGEVECGASTGGRQVVIL